MKRKAAIRPAGVSQIATFAIAVPATRAVDRPIQGMIQRVQPIKIHATPAGATVPRRGARTVESRRTATERHQTEVRGRVPLLFRVPPALFFSKTAPYIEGAGSPAMEINGRRNKPFGPGGSTRRLHPSPPLWSRVSAGANQDRRGRKGRVFSRYGSAVIGLCNSCKRQLCSGCSGCVTQFERPSLKS